MKVITCYPVYINGSLAESSEDWLSLDDSSPVSEIKAFQNWMDAKFPNGWAVRSDGTKYIVGKKASNGYGKFRKNTQNAWSEYESEYTSKSTTPAPQPPTTGASSPTETPVTPSTTTPEEKASTDKPSSTGKPITGKKRDKKSIFTTKNILIGAGGLVGIVLVIWGIRKLTK